MTVPVALLVSLLAVASPAAATSRPFLIDGRIVGGEEVHPVGKYPFQGSLQIFNPASGAYRHTCGCVVIGGKWALTAAHCTDGEGRNEDTLHVVLGMHDLNETQGEPEVYKIEKITEHPEYVGSGDLGYPNDICVLELRREINDDNQFIGAVTMAEEGLDYVQDDCVITGWGRTGLPNEVAETLQAAEMAAIGHEDCVGQMEGWTILETHICIISENATSCNGDSGGPLVCPVAEEWHFAGVTSWSLKDDGRCITDKPSVYTRVSKFREWIREITGI